MYRNSLFAGKRSGAGSGDHRFPQGSIGNSVKFGDGPAAVIRDDRHTRPLLRSMGVGRRDQ